MLRPRQSATNSNRTAVVAFSIFACGLMACGASKKREAGIVEMNRIDRAFGDLQIALDAGVSKDEFSRRLSDTLVKIGNLAESRTLAEGGFPKDIGRVGQTYDHFERAAQAYKLSKQFFGDRWDYLTNDNTDYPSESEQQMVKSAFPSLVPPSTGSITSRNTTLHGLWKLAAGETQDANVLLKQLSK